MAQPEKLNLWDRLFNRYRKEIITEGEETWFNRCGNIRVPNSEYQRRYVKYKSIDRVTGSETIEIQYLN